MDGPKDNSYWDRDIERVFGSELRDFEREVWCINDWLLDSFYFIAEYEGVFLTRFFCESVKLDWFCGLFYAHDGVTFRFEPVHNFHCILVIFPVYTELGS